jgi:hypothetical protein
MAKGWDISALRPNDKPYGRFLVAIADRDAAIRAIQAWLPDAKVVINSEAPPETLARFGLDNGKILAVT